jgi:hypothetical protein
MKVLNTMTKIGDNLRTHGGIACMARWALISRSLVADACTRHYKTQDERLEAERGHFATILAEQAPYQ